MKTKLSHPVFSSKIQNLTVAKNNQATDFFSKSTNKDTIADPYPISEVNKNTIQSKTTVNNEDWFPVEKDIYEGQLAVDVYQDKKNIYIKAAIAGVKPADIEIDLNNDMITIKGKRRITEDVSEENFYIKECYWGGFSRSIILPVDIINDSVRATIENGLLTITLPKSKRPRNTKIEVEKID